MSTVQSEIEKQFQFDVKDQHAGELLLGFNNARIERRLCDFVIKVGSKEMHVHKLVLSECSPYFRGMFSNKMREQASGFVEIKGVDPECMEICILYFYTGKASMFGSKLQQLLQAADMLQIPRLCEAIGSFLLTNLGPDSFFLTRKVANTFNLPALKEHCDKYAMEKFTSIAMKPDFKELEKEYVSFLIGSKENKASEAAKCKALILWTSSDQENRSKTFEEGFQMLQLEKIPADYRLYLSQEEPLVADSNKCLRNLSKSHLVNIGASMTSMKDFNLEGVCTAIAVFDETSKSIQAFHPENKNWTRVHGVTDEIMKKNFTAVAFDKTVYVLATDKTNYTLNYADPNATWTRLPDRQVTDKVLGVKVLGVILKGDLYALHDSVSSSLAIEKLDSSTTTWSRVADKHTASYYSAIVCTGDFLYSFGGINPDYSNDAVRFDPIARTWHRLPVMPTARYGAAAVELDGKIYVIGGCGDLNYLNTVECFDIQSETWATITPTNYEHHQFNACVIDCKIYAVGGHNSQNSIEEYDETSDSWNTVDKMAEKKIKDQATFSLHE